MPSCHINLDKHLPLIYTLSFAWMHSSPWLGVRYHYRQRRKTGLLKRMVSKLFAFAPSRKAWKGLSCLRPPADIFTTYWFMGRLEVAWCRRIRHYLSEPEPFLYLCIAAFNSLVAKKGLSTAPWHLKQLQYQQRGEVNILWYWSVTH